MIKIKLLNGDVHYIKEENLKYYAGAAVVEENSDAVSKQGGEPEPLRQPIHGERGSQTEFPRSKAEGSGGIQHVPSKASGKKSP